MKEMSFKPERRRPTDLDVFRATIGQLQHEDHRQTVSPDLHRVNIAALEDADRLIYQKINRALFASQDGRGAVTQGLMDELDEEFAAYTAALRALEEGSSADQNVARGRLPLRAHLAQMLNAIRINEKLR